MFPSPELRRRNIDWYHKMFLLGENFSRKQMAKWACDTIVPKMYVDRPWPRAGCLLRTQYTRYALHCAQENPRWIELCEFLWFLWVLCRSPAGQWGAIWYNRWRLCCREHHKMYLVSWGLKWYFGKIRLGTYKPEFSTVDYLLKSMVYSNPLTKISAK